MSRIVSLLAPVSESRYVQLAVWMFTSLVKRCFVLYFLYFTIFVSLPLESLPLNQPVIQVTFLARTEVK